MTLKDIQKPYGFRRACCLVTAVFVHADISADYVRRISEDIPVALGSSLKIVVDCGNGVAGALATRNY